MPGGVNSPVRAFSSVGGTPIVFDRVKGSHIWDVDNNEYIDYVGSWGTGIVGHANDEVIDVVKATAMKGTSFGAPSPLENELAKKVIEAVPSVEMVRFTSSGTEACMAALRLARAYTGRNKIIKFEGNYHGHADFVLVQAGSGVATLGLPNSPGVPKSSTADTLSAEYNNLAQVEEMLIKNKGQVAAIIIEPVVGNGGFTKPNPGFLQGLRDLCTKHGTLLIFDEVMTGFRISYGGAQEYFSVSPDLTTMGKIIGGGMPVGAYGGRKEIMSMISPSGPVYQAGTLSGNPVAMASGLKTLEILTRGTKEEARNPDGSFKNNYAAYDRLHYLSGKLFNGLQERFEKHYKGSSDAKLQGGYINGMFGYIFNKTPVENFTQAKNQDNHMFVQFHQEMLKRGIYLPPSPYEASFMSIAHTEADIDHTLDVAGEVFKILD